MSAAFPGRFQIEVQKGSFLPRSRDILTKKFLDSGCSHFLCIDSDIGWEASQVHQLLATGKDFVSGIYCQKTAEKKLPYKFLDGADGELRQCESVPGGFLLVSRQAVETMCREFSGMQYESEGHGRLHALWFPLFSRDIHYSSEDISFCIRHRAAGGAIWAHTGVVLKHFGETAFIPE